MKTKSSTSDDVLIIGGGHNGLTCACYLAQAGLNVRILERHAIVGGAAITEEFHPGFKNSVASYTVSLLNPKIIDDLNLYANGLKVVERDISNFYPLGKNEGDFLKLTFDEGRTCTEFEKLSVADAKRLPQYYQDIERAADVLREFTLMTPPNHGGGPVNWWRALQSGNKLRSLSLDDQRIVYDLFTKSAAEFLGRYFEHPSIIAAFAFDGIVGAYASPYTPGTAYVLLHHAFGEVNGKKGRWGHAIGGMGAISQAMARVAIERGVSIETEASVKNVIIENNKAVGVMLTKNEERRAKIVVSNLNPKLLFTDLIERRQLPSSFASRMDHYACGSGTFRMNVALSELPDFSCLPGKNAAEHHRSGIVIGPTVDYLDRAYLDARQHGWSRAPIIEMLIPSTMDNTLAPEGQHVASLFCQQFAPTLSDGKSWDDYRQDAAQTIIDIITRYAPNFAASIIGTQILSPLDLEKKFGLTGGDIFHGRLSLDQIFSARPQLGYADYRMPINNLYLCGSGAHPGGGVTGAPGHNAAREIIKDFKKGPV